MCGLLDYIDYIAGGGDKDVSYVSLMFMFFHEFVALFEFLRWILWSIAESEGLEIVHTVK